MGPQFAGLTGSTCVRMWTLKLLQAESMKGGLTFKSTRLLTFAWQRIENTVRDAARYPSSRREAMFL